MNTANTINIKKGIWEIEATKIIGKNFKVVLFLRNQDYISEREAKKEIIPLMAKSIAGNNA